jgi:diguanylate cyclase (GGDEF)-like protein
VKRECRWHTGRARGLLALLTLLPLLAFADRPPVFLDPGPSGQALTGAVAVTGDAALAAVLGGSVSWTYPDRALRTGRGEPLWLRVQFRVTEPGRFLLLELPTTALRTVDFYGPFTAGGEALQAPVHSGLRAPYATRPLGSERAVMPLGDLDPGDYRAYARLQADLTHTVTPIAWDLRDYQHERAHKRLFDGICYGVLLTLLVYNLALTAVFRDRSYGYYVFACAFALLTLATFNGHAAHYLWPGNPWLIEHSYQVAPALWLAFSGLFARAFLAVPGRLPRVDAILKLAIAAAIVNALLGAAGFTSLSHRSTELVALTGSLLMIGVSFRRWREGYAPALWYMLAICALFITIGLTVIVSWGLGNSAFLLGNALQMGILAEMVGLAMALSARIRVMQAEKLALTLRSRVLAEAAATDPLTGVANRNGLEEGAREILGQPGEHALMLLDLDRFKRINDSWGHAAGDALLTTVAERLREELRASDLIARSGGDEFVVLLGASPAREQLEAMARRLGERLSAPVPWEGEELTISASIGVALWPKDGHSLEALMLAADRAMYHSKRRRGTYAFFDSLAGGATGEAS